MDSLNSYRCSYVSGMSKGFFFFPLLNFQGNMKGIFLVGLNQLRYL